MSAVLKEAPARLPKDWYWTTLGEIADVIGGGTPRTNDATNFENGDIPWITPADLSGYIAKYISHGARFITRKGLESSSARLLPAETVLFTSRAPIGYVAIARNAVATNQGFKSFILKPGVLPEYVYWWLKGSKQRAESLASGTTFLELSGANAKKIPIPIAPIEEQRSIVAEIEKQFSRLDEAVANLKRVKANLNRYKAAVLEAAVEGHLVDTEAELARRESRGYETGAQLLRRVLDMRRDGWPSKSKYNKPVWADVAATLPEGWTWASLDALLREPLRNGHSARATDDPDGLRAFTLSAVTEGDFSEANTKRTVAAADKVTDLWAEPGDIYIERSNTPELVGTARLYRGPPGFAFIPDLLIRVRVSTGVLPGYAEFVLQADEARRYFKSRAQGISGSMPKIDQAVVQSVPVPLPPLAEQQRIIAEVERCFSFVHEVGLLVDANLKRSSRFRQALLSNAFSGVHPVCDRAQGAKLNDRGEIC